MPEKKILIADDQILNQELLSNFISMLNYHPVFADNGRVAIEKMRAENPEMVLLDLEMPEMSGRQALEIIKKDESLKHIPVVVVSASDDINIIAECIEMGADDYLTKPYNPTILKARISSCLTKKLMREKEQAYLKQIESYNLNLEEEVWTLAKEVTAGHTGVIFAMSKLAESRDPETGEHLLRMAEYCRVLARELQQKPKYAELIDQQFIDNIYAASPLHDIGKVGIPDGILQKAGKLTPSEFSVMQQHPLIGAKTLEEVLEHYPNNEFIKMGIEIARDHHEKWDGSGYPQGAKGEAISLPGRILALGDVYDALTSRRCYKEAYSHEKSRQFILDGRGKHFDPDVVDAFIAAEQQFISIRMQYQDATSEDVMELPTTQHYSSIYTPVLRYSVS